MAAPVSLAELKPGTCAVIKVIDSDGTDIDRLKTLGLCLGRQVEIVRRGDPMIVRVFGSRLGLSSRLASKVRAEPCSAPACPACCCEFPVP